MGVTFDKTKDEEWSKELIDHFDLQIWPRPIPVSERLPQFDETVLAYEDGAGWLSLILEENGQWTNSDTWWSDESTRITHWMPLPPKPEQDVEKLSP